MLACCILYIHAGTSKTMKNCDCNEQNTVGVSVHINDVVDSARGKRRGFVNRY